MVWKGDFAVASILRCSHNIIVFGGRQCYRWSVCSVEILINRESSRLEGYPVSVSQRCYLLEKVDAVIALFHGCPMVDTVRILYRQTSQFIDSQIRIVMNRNYHYYLIILYHKLDIRCQLV